MTLSLTACQGLGDQKVGQTGTLTAGGVTTGGTVINVPTTPATSSPTETKFNCPDGSIRLTPCTTGNPSTPIPGTTPPSTSQPVSPPTGQPVSPPPTTPPTSQPVSPPPTTTPPTTQPPSSPPPSPAVPSAPTGLNSTSITQTSFTLNWSAVNGATGYKVYKDNALALDNLVNLTANLTGLTAGTTYSMQVSAVNAGGEGAKSSALVVQTTATPVTNIGKVYFVSNRSGQRALWYMNADGSNKTKVTATQNEYNNFGMVHISSLSKVLFLSNKANTLGDIFTSNLDGSGELHPINTPSSRSWWGRWSPDGSKIGYGKDRNPANEVDIWVINADGSNDRQFTTVPSGYRTEECDWSPDGSKIVYTYRNTNESLREVYLYTMNASDGGNKSQLIKPNGTNIGGPRYSPDGSKIVFCLYDGSNSNIWVVNSNGSNLQQLTNTTTAYYAAPSWALDGSKIIFGKLNSGKWEIHTLNPNGTGDTLISDPAYDEFGSGWFNFN